LTNSRENVSGSVEPGVHVIVAGPPDVKLVGVPKEMAETKGRKRMTLDASDEVDHVYQRR